jgi:hypothetical protein
MMNTCDLLTPLHGDASSEISGEEEWREGRGSL